MSSQCTEDRFLKDVYLHQMNIIRDDGLYRHLPIKRPMACRCVQLHVRGQHQHRHTPVE